jgi:hypothetical protein
MITVKYSSLCAVVLGVSALLETGTASAHIKLKSPTSRDPNTELKSAPCGPDVSMRGSTMTMFTSGQKIMVEWDETIQHPGHYRIAFDSDGQDFPDPTSFTDVATANKDLGNGVVVLLDGIADMSGAVVGKTPYKAEVTLPDIECNNCTLQLIQVMTDKSPYGNGDDIYHECANLVLKKAGGAAAGSGGAGAAGSSGAAGAAAGRGAAGGGTAGSNAGGAGAAGAPVSSAAGVSGSAAGSGAVVSTTGAAGSAGIAPATAGSSAAGAPVAAPSASDSGCSVTQRGADRGAGSAGAVCFACAVALLARRRRR